MTSVSAMCDICWICGAKDGEPHRAECLPTRQRDYWHGQAILRRRERDERADKIAELNDRPLVGEVCCPMCGHEWHPA
jgi:hypothetical protein